MTSLIVDLKVIQQSQEIMYMSDAVAKELKLNSNIIPVYFGLGNYKFVKLYLFSSQKEQIIISSKLQESLLIPFPKKILVKRENNGLRIGPIIGILTTDYTGRKFTNITAYPENAFSLFFKGLLAPEPLYPAYYFVFTPEYVDWGTNTIKGYFYTEKKIWSLITVPIPDVIYNRVPNRTIEKQDYIVKFKNEYLLNGGKIFNSNFFNKWDIYRILAVNESTREYIPETYLNPSLNKLSEMAEKHPHVYLKPANGSLGLGIYKIIKKPAGYIAQYRRGKYNQALVFSKTSQLYKYIFMQKKQNRYVIQQGIDLIDYQNNPVDFRVQLHKNNLNKWQVVAVGAKAAGKGSVTTHLRTGGSLLDANQYLDNMFKRESSYIKQKIDEASIHIANILEEHLKSPLGELGLDIGIDKNLRIWLFEVNSKPGRSIFKHPSLKEARLESSKRLIEYGIYLSGFKINNVEK